MKIEFDPIKNAANIQKHGISLARAIDMNILAVVEDSRFDEPRFRAYGTLDGEAYCLAFTLRADVTRVISLRRAHLKETKRYVP